MSIETSTVNRVTYNGVEKFAKAGYTAKGAVYFLIGILAAMAAFGLGGQIGGKKQVFHEILQMPYGQVLLGAVALGLMGYTIWRFYQAFFNPMAADHDVKGIGKRVAYFLSGLAYLGFALMSALPVVQNLGGASAGSGSNGGGRQMMIEKLLEQPFGQWLVGVVAVFLFSVAIFQFYRGYSGRYRKKIKELGMSEKEQKMLLVGGKVGYPSRGVVLAIIAFFILKSAITHDASSTQNTEGAFQFLQNTWGPWLMGIVALGFVVYGVYCFIKARHMKVKI